MNFFLTQTIRLLIPQFSQGKGRQIMCNLASEAAFQFRKEAMYQKFEIRVDSPNSSHNSFPRLFRLVPMQL